LNSTNYEVPHYEIFSILVTSFLFGLLSVLSMLLCSETPSIYVLLLELHTEIHTRKRVL